jgi:hypothetical protein
LHGPGREGEGNRHKKAKAAQDFSRDLWADTTPPAGSLLYITLNTVGTQNFFRKIFSCSDPPGHSQWIVSFILKSLQMSYFAEIGKQIMKSENLETRVMKRIARKRCDVFLRADFKDLGGYDQVGRALRGLVRNGRLLKLGQGLYTRAAPSPFDGSPAPVKGLRAVAAEALKRLGVETSPTKFEKAYSTGKTDQVPAGRVIAVRKRVRRKIGYNGINLSFERARS